MGRVLIFICPWFFLLFSCNRTNQQYDKPYFDFDSLVQAQVAELVKARSTIKKKSVINGKADDSSYVPDSVKIANELDVFRQLDLINKPLYKSMYEIRDGEKDIKSNLLVRTYLAKIPSPVPFVKFYYQPSPPILKKIESVFQEHNPLLDTRRTLMLAFDDGNGSVLISGYQMSGTQKMILNDTVHFSVEVSFLTGKH
jgi:hypothetical protein